MSAFGECNEESKKCKIPNNNLVHKTYNSNNANSHEKNSNYKKHAECEQKGKGTFQLENF